LRYSIIVDKLKQINNLEYMESHKQLRGVELKRFVRINKIKKDFELILILLNLSYATNVAAIFRLADAFSVDKMFLVGCTTTPPFGKAMKSVSRGKEDSVHWEYAETFENTVVKLKKQDFQIYGLELASEAKPINDLSSRKVKKVALVVGNEEHGIPDKHLLLMDDVFYIPMGGKGKSLNVSNTTGIGLYQITVGSNLS